MKNIPILALFVLFTSIVGWVGSAQAALPPKYLSVPQWQDCVETVTKGTAQFICLPSDKPKNCPDESWQELIGLNEIDLCS